MKSTRKMTTYDYLAEFEYFTEEELRLVISGWGDNQNTYDTICQVRYGMDVDQLALEDIEEGEDNIFLTDYHSEFLHE